MVWVAMEVRCSDMSAIEECTDFVILIVKGAPCNRCIMRVADPVIRFRCLLAYSEVLLLLLSAGLLEVAQSSRTLMISLVCA